MRSVNNFAFSDHFMPDSGASCVQYLASRLKDISAAGGSSHAPGQPAACESMTSLLDIADTLGVTGRLIELNHMGEAAEFFPSIFECVGGGYIIVESARARRLKIRTTGGAAYWSDKEAVADRLTGRLIELQLPADYVQQANKRRLSLVGLLSNLRGLKTTIVKTAFLSVIAQITALTLPYYIQIAIDSSAVQGDIELVIWMALGFGLVAIMNGVAIYVRGLILASESSVFLDSLASDLSRKLMRLRPDWYGSRTIGEISSNFRAIAQIKQVLSEDVASIMVDGILAFLTLAVMVVYSPILAAVSLSGFIFDVAYKIVTSKPQKQARNDYLVASAEEYTTFFENIKNVRAIRIANQESKRQALWQASTAKLINADIRCQNLTNSQVAVERVTLNLETLMVVCVAIYLVSRSSLTVGMMVAYLSYKTQFLATAGSATQRILSVNLLRPALSRIEQIAFSEDAVKYHREYSSHRNLIGNIELRDISFSYPDTNVNTLRNVNLSIAAGSSVVITGPSGQGKSTLVKIMTGLLDLKDGVVLVDGIPLKEFGIRSFYNQVSVIMQDDGLFAGTIAANISEFSENVDFDHVVRCSELAMLKQEIDGLTAGFQTVLDDSGGPLSGGQRQRLLLARALYRTPKVLIVDEGTSQLDEACEQSIEAALQTLGITRITVAHRLKTIDNAQHLVRIDNGHLVKVR